MGKAHKGPTTPRLDKGLQNSPTGNALPIKSSRQACHKQGTKCNFIKRGVQHVGNGCDSKSESYKGGNYKQCFHKGEKGERPIQADSKLKTIKLLHTPRKIQNGNTKKCERSPATRRSHDKNRSKTRVLLSEYGKRKQKASQIHLERDSLGVHLPCVRLGTSSEDVHKTAKSSHNCSAENKHQNSDINRRHANYCRLATGNGAGKRHNPIPPAEHRVCDKLGEIFSRTNQTDRFSGGTNRLNKHDILHSGTQAEQNNFVLSVNPTKPLHLVEKPCQPHRETNVHIRGILPAPLQVRYLQNLLRENLKTKSYEAMIHLSAKALSELYWWKENLVLHNPIGKPLKIQPPEMIISSDAAGGNQGGWGQHAREYQRGEHGHEQNRNYTSMSWS